jgi:hypothetical protein
VKELEIFGVSIWLNKRLIFKINDSHDLNCVKMIEWSSITSPSTNQKWLFHDFFTAILPSHSQSQSISDRWFFPHILTLFPNFSNFTTPDTFIRLHLHNCDFFQSKLTQFPHCIVVIETWRIQNFDLDTDVKSDLRANGAADHFRVFASSSSKLFRE